MTCDQGWSEPSKKARAAGEATATSRVPSTEAARLRKFDFDQHGFTIWDQSFSLLPPVPTFLSLIDFFSLHDLPLEKFHDVLATLCPRGEGGGVERMREEEWREREGEREAQSSRARERGERDRETERQRDREVRQRCNQQLRDNNAGTCRGRRSPPTPMPTFRCAHGGSER